MEKILLRKMRCGIMLFIATMLLGLPAYAQIHRITGTIISAEDSKPMPGVSIKVSGATTGTVSLTDGTYSIMAKSTDVLIFSFISYTSQQIYVGSSNSIDVKMSQSTSNLNEVVVIGYGNSKRKDLTGSISSVSATNIVEAHPTTIDQALQGRVAGVVVQQVSGQPGGDVNIQIRGIGGFTNAPPLYVIDGVQIPPNVQSPIPGEGSNPLSTINPSDIASIDILKDASATAIYGSQASNGVVIITTKKGVMGPPLISYDGYAGEQSLSKYYDVMNLQQYATFMNEKAAIIGYDLRPQFANPQYLGTGTDWQKALYRTAPEENHNISISGGDARTKYFLSGTYFSQEGIALGSDFKRTTLKVNIDNKTTNWLKIGTNLAFAHVAENVATTNTGVILQALNQTPDVEVKNPDGTWGGNDPNIYGAYGANPFALASIVTDFKSRYQLIGNAYAEIQFTKDLTLRNEVSGNFDFATEDYFDPTYTMGAYTNTTNTGTSTSAQNFYNSITNYLTYSHFFNKSKLWFSATAGHEAQKVNGSTVSATRTNFVSNNVTTISSGDPTTALNSGIKSDGALEAYFGRANLTFDDKYTLTGTIRRDGTSKIDVTNRWNTSYSGAFAWKLNNEAFLKDVKAIDDLKLRLSYGLVNNQNIAEYAYGSTLTTVATGLSGNSQLTSTLGNPDIKWETTKEYNLGLDASVLNNRITFTGDVYYRKTDNLLLSLTEPYYSGTYAAGGYSPGAILAPYVNIGSVSNKGIEFSIATTNIKSKDFNWRTNLIYSQNKNTVLALSPGTPAIYGTYTKTIVGRSIGEFYGYQTLGLYKDAADFAKYPAVWQNGSGPIPITPGSGGVWVGDVIYKDNNKDGKIDANDETFLGSPLPKFQYGINNTFNYKNFDLTVFMTGEYGNKVFNQIGVNGSDPNQNFGYFASVANYARIGLINPSGSASDINNVYITNPSTKITRISQSSGDQNTIFSDRYIEDGSFLKCKSIALGYNFSQSVLSKLHLRSLRIYANVTNVFTITKYTGYDPEIGSWNPLAAGIDNGYYAQPRVISIGANISLNN
ncbi:TonB-linked SusC/RagA family outer membrane protein [Mucilaginibacter frigoritolerans]|uniref:TonB-linked SusC/RagA family outer membrane protein n=1 Tax=Mucilaginibacter frigoritolerans TaxID=652788 RepID=A0A562TNY2_9SPHI|nr:TonB-dependent receptor [Mucilaginibacter frigoritolerans]TWI95271.1 TonB-linked SusC/RagA family outer membrane protein [Mucilaginibacter frigoritolerans]